MKKVFALIAVAILSVAFSTQAQMRYDYATLTTTPATTVVGSTASNTPNAIIDCRKMSSVAVWIKQTYDGAGTDAMGYYFQRSIDGSTWATPGQYVTVAGTGNTAVNTITNIPTYGAGYIKLSYVTNASAGSVSATNLTVKYAIKTGVP